MKTLKTRISHWLTKQPTWVFAIYASITAFLTYSCMYAFRKPFTVGIFAGQSLFGIDFKILLITSQVVGYTLSKFIGIKFVSEMKRTHRAKAIILLVGTACFSLFLFCFIPPPLNIACMLINGLSLGIIWGIVFSYLEGRRLTELLGAGLCASFIVATGMVKSVGKMVLINLHASEFSMPLITGLIFAIPLIISVFFLDCIPSPTMEDEVLRTMRKPMNREERKSFIRYFFTGIVLLVLAYTFLTIFRELRDNFSAEIWTSLGFGNNPAIFTIAELPVAFFTLISLALITFIRSNYKAFTLILYIVLSGFILIILSTVLFSAKLIGGEVWMITVGIGLYLGYVPFNAFLYERLISTFKYVSNIGFAIYVSDAFGYLGSLGVVFYKNFFSPGQTWIHFFIQSGFWFSLAGVFMMIFAILYFKRKYYHFKTGLNYELQFTASESLLTLNTGTSVNK
jgi:hypothetical protein